jgi:tetratricopeptide (TPR) repeat protein
MNGFITTDERIIERTPYSLVKLGKLFAAAGRHKEAIKHYNEAIMMKPNENNFFFLKGVSEFHLKLFYKSLSDLNLALKSEPLNRFEILNYTGAIRFYLGDYKKALLDLEQVLRYFKGDYMMLKISFKDFTELLKKC